MLYWAWFFHGKINVLVLSSQQHFIDETVFFQFDVNFCQNRGTLRDRTIHERLARPLPAATIVCRVVYKKRGELLEPHE